MTGSAGGWTAAELDTIAATDEIDIASRRDDGTLRAARIVWVVRHHDGLYVRSVLGPDAAWYRGVQTRHEGHLRADGVDRDVRFVEVDHTPGGARDDSLDEVYRDKYGAGPEPIEHITSPLARQTTLRLDPV
jgi:hypothetical protein